MFSRPLVVCIFSWLCFKQHYTFHTCIVLVLTQQGLSLLQPAAAPQLVWGYVKTEISWRAFHARIQFNHLQNDEKYWQYFVSVVRKPLILEVRAVESNFSLLSFPITKVYIASSNKKCSTLQYCEDGAERKICVHPTYWGETKYTRSFFTQSKIVQILPAGCSKQIS